MQATAGGKGCVQAKSGTGRKAALILAVIVGAWLTALSMSSEAHAWLGWFALVPIFFMIRLWRPTHALLGGAIWGACLFAFSSGSFQEAPVSALARFLRSTAAPAIYCGSAAWLSRRIGFSPFVLGVGWMGVEFALVQAGFRTGLLGLAAGGGGVLHWLGEILGWIFVCFLFALLNAWVVVGLGRVRLCAGPRRARTSITDSISYFASQTFAGFPLFSVPASQPRAPPLRSPWAQLRLGIHSMHAAASA